MDSYVRPRSTPGSISSSRSSRARARCAPPWPAARCARPPTRSTRCAPRSRTWSVPRPDAAAAELDARKQHADAEARLVELDLAHERQEDLVADIETRLDHLLSEAAALQSRDADLAAQITQRQAALAAQAAAAAAAGSGGHPTPRAPAQRPTAGAGLPVERQHRLGDRGGIVVGSRDRRPARPDARRCRRRRDHPRRRRLAQPRRADRHPHGRVRHQRLRHLGDALLGVLTPRRPTRAARCTSRASPSTSPPAAT